MQKARKFPLEESSECNFLRKRDRKLICRENDSGDIEYNQSRETPRVA